MINLLAGIGLLINDFLALISIFASVILLFDYSRNQDRHRKRNQKLIEWSVLGYICASIFQFAIIITDQSSQPIGIFFRFNSVIINSLLIFSLLLILVRLILGIRNNRQYS